MGNPKKRASSATSKPRKLTPQRENFARHVVMGYTAAGAYRRAFVVDDDTKPSTVWNNAYMLMANKEVKARIAELTAQANEKAMISRNSMLEEMGFNRSISLDHGKFSVAASSSLARARVARLLEKEPAAPPPAPESAAGIVNAELSQEERTLNEIGRRVYFTLELGKRRGKTKVKVAVEENNA